MKLQESDKVVIVGTSGSGKTTLARRLCERLHLKDIELDALNWLPGWTEATHEDFRKKVDEATAENCGWVVHGNYGRVNDLTLGRANVLIWLDYSRPVVFYRVFKRSVLRILTREKLWGGENRESFKKTFLSRDSILLWSINTWSNNKNRYSRYISENTWPHLKILRMTSPEETEKFLKSL